MSDTLSRIHAALDRIEASLQRPKAQPVDVDAMIAPLMARHDILRSHVANTIAEIDELIRVTENH